MTRAELTEAVARAVYARGDWRRIKSWEECPRPYRAMCLADASAALAVVAEAMWGPTPKMHEAGFKQSIGGQMGEWMHDGFPAINSAIWRAMLAASPLAEDQP